VPEAEVARVLTLAREAGVKVLDTGRLYGESEAVLGRSLAGSSYWRIVTKTAKFAKLSDANAVRRRFTSDLARSLSDLSLSSIYGLLAHDADDLLGMRGTILWEALTRARARGIVTKIGASAYRPTQIEALLDRFDVDLIQLPTNAIDQRLVHSGLLPRLKSRGVEVHARSTFLQGLLLVPADTIDARFGILRTRIAALQAAWREAGMTHLEGALAAVLRQPEIDCVIIGTSSLEEFREVLATYQRTLHMAPQLALEQWALDDEAYVNPALWKQFLDI
jgi:aryl-alcohol dehydrogenase-like predicted oxidoreductase